VKILPREEYGGACRVAVPSHTGEVQRWRHDGSRREDGLAWNAVTNQVALSAMSGSNCI
jgi:hypothetical protein